LKIITKKLTYYPTAFGINPYRYYFTRYYFTHYYWLNYFVVLSPKPAKKPVIIKTLLVEVKNMTRKNVDFVIALTGGVINASLITVDYY
jgi:hypothetical protein